MTHRNRIRTAMRVIWVAVGALALLLLIGLLVAAVRLNDQNDKLDERVDAADAAQSQLKDDLEDRAVEADALEQQIRQLGEQPVVIPDDIDDAPIVIAGQKGDRGPSCIEEIGYPRCRGTAGDDGTNGSAGSVGASCVAELGLEACRGPKGDTGEKGEPGKDGAPGADGRGVATITCTDGQVVVTYTDGATQTVAGWPCGGPGNSGDNR